MHIYILIYKLAQIDSVVVCSDVWKRLRGESIEVSLFIDTRIQSMNQILGVGQEPGLRYRTAECFVNNRRADCTCFAG